MNIDNYIIYLCMYYESVLTTNNSMLVETVLMSMAADFND